MGLCTPPAQECGCNEVDGLELYLESEDVGIVQQVHQGTNPLPIFHLWYLIDVVRCPWGGCVFKKRLHFGGGRDAR